MNAPQFGPAANGAAAPVVNSLPFNFAGAASTNPVIPDFKTVAASFFAVPTAVTTVAPVETKSTAGAKPTGPFLPRERENKEKDPQGSELPAAFLPSIPVYPFPLLTPEAPKHMEPLSPEQQPNTKNSSPAPSFTLPLENQRQGFDQILPPQLATRPMAPNVPFVPSQPTLKNVEPQKPAAAPVQLDDAKNTEIQDASTAGAKTVTPQAFTDADPTTNNANLDDINTGETVKETAAITNTEVEPKTQTFPGSPLRTEAIPPHAKITSNPAKAASITAAKENELSDANNITAGLNTTEIDTRQKNAANFGEKLSSKLAKTIGATENKKSTQTKQSLEAQQDDGTDAKLPDSTMAADQTPQQYTTPQSLDDAIKAAIPQAVVLEHTVNSQTPGHTSFRATPSGKSAASKANQAESNSAEANVIASPLSEKISTEELNATRTVPTIESATKVAAKTKPDTTVKKAQKVGAENQADSAAPTAGSDPSEIQSASSPQNTTNKIHDAVTSQLNVGPHAKSSNAKNAPGGSDLTSPNATQVPDVDDITPPSHAGINTAKLVQGLTQSELRVGLQTREFGNIDIRTSASRHEFTAQISVEHSEVAHTLTSELPNLYARLNEQQVPVSNIHIHNQSLSTSSGLDQRSQQSAQQSQSNGFMKQPAEPTLPPVHEVFGSTDRLDIRV